MTRRYFWQLPECTRFRIVFENEDIVLGVDRGGSQKVFRKDSGRVSFRGGPRLSRRVRDITKARPKIRIARLVPRLIPLRGT